MKQPIKKSFRMQEGGDPIFIFMTYHDTHLPIPNPKQTSALALNQTDAPRCSQLYYSGLFEAVSAAELSKKYKSLETTVSQFIEDQRQEQDFNIVRGGYPLVLFKSDENGNPVYNSRFSLVFLGNFFDSLSNENFGLVYKGPLVVREYRQALSEATNADEIKQRFYDLAHYLTEKRTKKAEKQARKKQRRFARSILPMQKPDLDEARRAG